MNFDYSKRLQICAENYLVRLFEGEIPMVEGGRNDMGVEQRYPYQDHILTDAAMHVVSNKMWRVEPHSLNMYFSEEEATIDEGPERQGGV